ncbi:CpsD/CapB family tyrosine-protein kinase [Paenibacillus eucommiae]|uniref:non-specific protein-tyrosine kinase n=1 Tax=Paenibacillus eucommiae TaxID=1355755 RepID=A0ABS4J3X3_9BACL|nr:CpsD/CapB family tyrosine-protein kinase [Paenibacillus eucommiae]MBP1993985.1 capsular exopolysaccharide synthesis family protein [Paenibacillus eucommiae]
MSVPTSKNKYLLVTNTNPKSIISESYKTLRTNLTFSAVDQAIKRILVTSSQPGEGKSTTIANLAVTFAQENKRVLLIDADLRKPALHHFFVKSNRYGLTNVLINQGQAASSILETDIPNLSIIPSGPVPPNPSELLASQKMKALLEQLDAEYDLILIDSPPSLAVTDAQILSTLCDGVLLVVHYGKVKQQLVQKSLLGFEHVKARVLGVVINNIMSPKDGSSSYYYM